MPRSLHTEPSPQLSQNGSVAALRVLQLEPSRIDVRVWLALAKEQDGDLPGALAEYKDILSKAPTDAAQLQQFQAAQGQLGAALSRLLLVAERYPELKANQNFLSLQAQLEGTENRISVERGNFNQTVQDYNVAVRSFPTNLIAGMLGFPPKPFFAAQPGAEKPPPVQFNFNSPAPAPATTP